MLCLGCPYSTLASPEKFRYALGLTRVALPFASSSLRARLSLSFSHLTYSTGHTLPLHTPLPHSLHTPLWTAELPPARPRLLPAEDRHCHPLLDNSLPTSRVAQSRAALCHHWRWKSCDDLLVRTYVVSYVSPLPSSLPLFLLLSTSGSYFLRTEPFPRSYLSLVSIISVNSCVRSAVLRRVTRRVIAPDAVPGERRSASNSLSPFECPWLHNY